jgi:hypothetical protein
MTYGQACDYIERCSLRLNHKVNLFTGPKFNVDYEKLISRKKKTVAALEAFCFENLDTAPTFAEFSNAQRWIDG